MKEEILAKHTKGGYVLPGKRLTVDEEQYLRNQFPLYNTRRDWLRALITGNYFRCAHCKQIASFPIDANIRCCSKACSVAMRNESNKKNWKANKTVRVAKLREWHKRVPREVWCQAAVKRESKLDRKAMGKKISQAQKGRRNAGSIAALHQYRQKGKESLLNRSAEAKAKTRIKTLRTLYAPYFDTSDCNSKLDIVNAYLATLNLSNPEGIEFNIGLPLKLISRELCEVYLKLRKPERSLFDEQYDSDSNARTNARKVGLKLPRKRISKGELWLQSLFPEARTNVRDIVPDVELDLYLKEYQLAIEFNGCYWHSDCDKPDNYHKAKSDACAAHGIQLIHVWENDYEHNRELVESMLRVKTGNAARVYARNCQLGYPTNHEAEAFFNHNHLQGHRLAKHYLGLQYGGEWVMMISLSSSDKADYELIRMASARDTIVVGGASRLLSKVEGSIFTYADYDISDGGVYTACGFEWIGNTPPSYFYVEQATLLKVSRHTLMKHKLKQLFPQHYQETLTERQIVDSTRKYFRIYTSGNMKFLRKNVNKHNSLQNEEI